MDDRSGGQCLEPKPRDLSSHNGNFLNYYHIFILYKYNIIYLFFKHIGSSNGHSPVLNLSKSGGLDQGSTGGDHSDHSEIHSLPPPTPSIRDEDENISDDNVSDVDEHEVKDEGI